MVIEQILDGRLVSVEFNIDEVETVKGLASRFNLTFAEEMEKIIMRGMNGFDKDLD